VRSIYLKSSGSFIVISDVHLRDPDDELTKIFLTTLEQILLLKQEENNQIESLFLLGDIFDFFAASHSFFFKLWKNVFDTIKKLKENGIAVYFIEGNHDFGFEHFPSKILNEHFTAYGDFCVKMDHASFGRTVLTHGDQIICPPIYLTFRSLVKSRFWQKIVSFLFPGFFMHFLFSRYAKLSRSHDQYRELPRTFLEGCLAKYLAENLAPLSTLILGHIHMTIDENFKGTHILIGPDWLSAPSYLMCKASGKCERIYCPV